MNRQLEDERTRARDLYIYDGKSFDQIAHILSVHVRTVRRWARIGDWKKDRTAHIASPIEIAAQLKQTLANITEELREKNVGKGYVADSLIDSICKLTTAIAKLDGQSDERGETLRAIDKLVAFCTVYRHTALLKALYPVLDHFYEWVNKQTNA